jgi:hypothetical protein
MMTSFKRRILWGAAIILLFLIGLALYTYTVGTRTMLERAEAFSFRRLSVAQLEDQDAFRFFYMTNRQPGDLQGPVEERYKSRARGHHSNSVLSTPVSSPHLDWASSSIRVNGS